MHMKTFAKHAAITTVAVGALAAAGFALFTYSGVYNVGADDPHLPWVYSALETVREKSIEARTADIVVPDLSGASRVVQGAGNYAAMCAGCHLAPGVASSELSMGLYPSPPNLSTGTTSPAKAFWVIKHGIKASGMPAWGESIPDEYIWNLAAFLQELPQLSSAEYGQMVASSGGHMHGGMEDGEGHAHGAGARMHEGMAEHGHGDHSHAPSDAHAEAEDTANGAPEESDHPHAANGRPHGHPDQGGGRDDHDSSVQKR